MRRKRNLDGYMEGGVFHPIRGSAGYDDEKLGSIDFNFGANVPQKRGRGRPKGPTQKTLEKKRREYEERNRKRDLRERLARRRELASFVRRSGGIRYDGMHDGEIKRLGRHESGTSGLVSVDRGKGLQRRAGRGLKPDTMREHAVEAGLIPESMSISDFLRAVEHSATVRNPKKKNAGFEDTRRITHKLGIPQGSQVAFTVDRNGRPVAFRYSHAAMRWIRVGYDEAKIAVSTGKAREVRKNPKGKPARKPLAREWGESDSGTQPTLFIKGDKKHAGQETFEELFHRAEQEAKQKKSNPGGMSAALDRLNQKKQWGLFVHRGDGRYRRSEAIQVFSTLRAAEAAANKAYDAGNYTIVVRDMSYLLNPAKNNPFPSAAVEKAWQAWRKAEKAKSPKAQELESKFVKAYMANKKKHNPPQTLKKATRTPKKVRGAKNPARKRNFTIRAAGRLKIGNPSKGAYYQVFKKQDGNWIAFGAYSKLAQARNAAKGLSGRGNAVKIVSGQTQKEIKPRHKNLAVKIGGKTGFKASRKGVSIGGRVKLTANPGQRRVQRLAIAAQKQYGKAKDVQAFERWQQAHKKHWAAQQRRGARTKAAKRTLQMWAANPGRAEKYKQAIRRHAKDRAKIYAAGSRIQPVRAWAAYLKADKATRKPNGKRNGIFEKFHGRKATRVSGLNAPDGTPRTLDKLGKLVSLHAAQGTIKPNGSTVWLCSDQKGRLHLATSGARLIDGPAQNFGEVKKIEYETTKTHLDGKPAIYYHFFGEEGGKRPTLVSDGKGGLRLRGGSYKIRAEGIRD